MKMAKALLTVGLLAAVGGTPADARQVQTSDRRETYLYVRTSPPGATILLNDDAAGRTNRLLEVTPGSHRLRLERPGYAPERREVEARHGEVTRVEVTLKKEAGFPTGPQSPERKEVERLVKEAVDQAEAGDMGVAQETLAEARKVTQRLPDQTLQDWTLAELAKAHAELGDFAGALACVELIRDVPRWATAAHDIIIMQARAGDYRGARATWEGLLKDFSGAGRRVSSRRSEFYHFVRAKSEAAQEEIETLERLQPSRRAQMPPYGERDGGQGEEVERLAKEAVARAEAGNMAAAQQTLAKAKETAKGIAQQSLQDWAFSHLANAHAQLDDFAGAVTCTGMIQGVQRYVDTAYEVVVMQARAGDFQGANASKLKLFSTSRGDNVHLSPERRAARDEIEKLQKARRSAAQGAGPAANSQPAPLDRREVERLANEAVARAEAGDMGAAQEILANAREAAARIPQQALQDWVLAELAKTHAQLKDFAGAVTCTRMIEDDHRYIDTAYEVVVMQAREGDFRGAKASHDRLFGTGSGRSVDVRSSQNPKNRAALAEIEKLEKARRSAEPSAKSPGEERKEVERLAREAVSHAEAADLGAAHEVLATARATAERISQQSVRDWMFANLAKTHAEVEDFAGSVACVRMIKTPARYLDTAYEVVVMQARAGDFTGARDTHQRLFSERLSDRPQSLYETPTSLIRSKSDAALEQLAKLQDAEGVTSATRNEVDRLIQEAVASAEAGDVGAAQESLGKALSAARSIIRQASRESCLEQIARACAQVQDHRGAKEALEQIEDDNQRSVAAYDVALILARAGDFEAAREMASDGIPYHVSTPGGRRLSSRSRDRLQKAQDEIDKIERLGR